MNPKRVLLVLATLSVAVLAILLLTKNTPLVYQNTEYRFTVALPQSWKGYTVVSDTWEGLSVESGAVTATGPLISIRHPKWTTAEPRQDIPIMIFTIAKWDALQKEEFHIGAAPIPPREVARSNSYVFALPARYNYAFPTGYEEVETILTGNPLRAY